MYVLLSAQVYLGQQYVNNPTLSDVTFVIEDRKFFAHRIALLASSDAFRAMFEGTFREKAATEIPIPNIRYEVFERMMHCIYTGAPLPPPLPTLHDVWYLGLLLFCNQCDRPGRS